LRLTPVHLRSRLIGVHLVGWLIVLGRWLIGVHLVGWLIVLGRWLIVLGRRLIVVVLGRRLIVVVLGRRLIVVVLGRRLIVRHCHSCFTSFRFTFW